MDKKIIIVSAVWCPSCLILKKHIKKLKENYPNINIELLDYDFDEEEVNKYHVGDILPVIIIGEKRLIGEKNYDEIIDFLKECDIL